MNGRCVSSNRVSALQYAPDEGWPEIEPALADAHGFSVRSEGSAVIFRIPRLGPYLHDLAKVSGDFGRASGAEVGSREKLEIRAQDSFLRWRRCPQLDRRHPPFAHRAGALPNLQRDEENLGQLLPRIARGPGLAGDGDGIDVAHSRRFQRDQVGVDGDGLELDAERGEVWTVGGAVAGPELALDDLARPALGPHRAHRHGHTKSVRHLGQRRAQERARVTKQGFAI